MAILALTVLSFYAILVYQSPAVTTGPVLLTVRPDLYVCFFAFHQVTFGSAVKAQPRT